MIFCKNTGIYVLLNGEKRVFPLSRARSCFQFKYSFRKIVDHFITEYFNATIWV